ncbi:gas vesicle protein GvpJ [Streptomyces sp. NPDC047821]|uniref:gas vesicle protein GvpJ n=1 Tax=unclassified Streptomyces TaxID=2593676 RepID=UPI00362EE60C
MTLDARSGTSGPSAPDALPQRQVALIDLLDRLLTGGVVVTGDVVLSIADIDLVRVSLRALIVSISEENPSPWGRAATAAPHDPHAARS